MTDETLEQSKTPLLVYEFSPPQLEWNLFWPFQLFQFPIHGDLVLQNDILWIKHHHEPILSKTDKQKQKDMF